jgi:hypothetical protein
MLTRNRGFVPLFECQVVVDLSENKEYYPTIFLLCPYQPLKPLIGSSVFSALFIFYLLNFKHHEKNHDQRTPCRPKEQECKA